MELRYGTNPHQRPARAEPLTHQPIRVLSGEPSYINLLDALAGWRLVREAGAALAKPAAASVKHVSPAGAAIAGAIDEVIAETYGVDASPGALTSAYLRARDADPKSSYGDFIAVSQPVDAELADLLRGVISDGIIAPDFEPGVVGALSAKKGGRFLVVQADPGFSPPASESREVFGLRLTERTDDQPITGQVLTDIRCGALTDQARADLLLGLIVLRYTQSNSVAYLRAGKTVGIGAGQQSRVDCTRLAGAKADSWWLRRHPAVRGLRFRDGIRKQDRLNWRIRYLEGDLTPNEVIGFRAALLEEPAPFTDRADWLERLNDISFVSDGALPFRDNIDHAHRHGARFVAEPGGSIRSDDVERACRELGVTLVRTGLRLFRH
ncbi:MAG TPA: phosphoribosylaminoimidazolecarboxamide formyltransferase [Mycobacteriales bacterium]|jgi:phosphoribosylaminoimidazolecarboxamide formyltransferase/IMP cyclohydrolase|nr:phosphoribosylaminoimidazolecarboxamide formyltransferase [Mycobacteriales bacterium]